MKSFIQITLLIALPFLLCAQGYDDGIRRLRNGKQVRNNKCMVSCENNQQRHQAKYTVNGRSYFFRKMTTQPLPDDESRPIVRRIVKRKRKDVKRGKARNSKSELFSSRVKLNWNRSFADARRKFLVRRYDRRE